MVGQDTCVGEQANEPSVRIGAVHLGWNVLAVAAGGGDKPVRPIQVEGSFTPPAYLLADRQGRLHTGGGAKTKVGVGLAIADVREVLAYPSVVIAGATWPTSAIFRARLHNPITEIRSYLGDVDLLALPYPYDWDDATIDTYCELVAALGVDVDPVPESVALAGYVRATEFGGDAVTTGMTAVYCDMRTALVVAVHADPDKPTESVDVTVSPDAKSDPHAADQFVYDIMSAARSVQGETTTVVLTGAVCFNDSIRLAFRNHLGPRLHIADHPMHAIALGAVDMLAAETIAAGQPEWHADLLSEEYRPSTNGVSSSVHHPPVPEEPDTAEQPTAVTPAGAELVEKPLTNGKLPSAETDQDIPGHQEPASEAPVSDQELPETDQEQAPTDPAPPASDLESAQAPPPPVEPTSAVASAADRSERPLSSKIFRIRNIRGDSVTPGLTRPEDETSEATAGPLRGLRDRLERAAAGRRWALTVAAAVALLAMAVGAMIWLGPDTLSPDSASRRVADAMLAADSLEGLPVVVSPGISHGTVENRTVTVTTGNDMVSMACASIPLTVMEAKSAKASASQIFAAASGPHAGDGVALRATYYAPGTIDDVLATVLQRVQNCPNRESDTLRYIVPVPSNGDDPGPPVQVDAPRPDGQPRLNTADGRRLAWRGLVPISQSPIGKSEQGTCLVDRMGDLVIRSCGMSVDSRRADTLADAGLAALRGR